VNCDHIELEQTTAQPVNLKTPWFFVGQRERVIEDPL
jgi:hypothetical protein